MPRASPLIIPALRKHTATIFILHGLGDSGLGWEPVARLLAPKLPHVKWVLPHAPQVAITVFERQATPAWFDIRSWNLDSSATPQDEEGILHSVAQVQGWVEAEERESGIPASRIVVGGFSQGAAIALVSLLRAPKPLAGYVLLSGFQTLAGDETWALANRQTPIFMGHGDADEVVPHASGRRAYELLQQHGHAAVAFHTYRGMPHSVSPPELEDLTTYLTGVLPPEA